MIPGSRLCVALLRAAAAATAAAAAEPDCADVPLCARLRPDAVFFVGEAVEERHLPGRLPEYKFLVREALRGLAEGTELIVIESPEGAPPHGRLLVEARSVTEGRFARGHCDYARPADDDGAQADLALLRERGASASIAVSLVDRSQRQLAAESLASTRVWIEGALHRAADRSPDSSSRTQFTAANLPPGRYRIGVQAPGYETAAHSETLAAGACDTVTVSLHGSASIHGRIRNASLSAASAWIRLIDPAQTPGLVIAEARTDGDGGFALTGVAPGRYLMSFGTAAGSDAAPQLYYPGLAERDRAAFIEVAPGARIMLDTLTLP